MKRGREDGKQEGEEERKRACLGEGIKQVSGHPNMKTAAVPRLASFILSPSAPILQQMFRQPSLTGSFRSSQENTHPIPVSISEAKKIEEKVTIFVPPHTNGTSVSRDSVQSERSQQSPDKNPFLKKCERDWPDHILENGNPPRKDNGNLPLLCFRIIQAMKEKPRSREELANITGYARQRVNPIIFALFHNFSSVSLGLHRPGCI